MKVLFTGGGTGGHVLPIIAIARELRRLYNEADLEVYHMGPKDRFSQMLLSQEGIRMYTVGAGKMRRSWNPFALAHNIYDMVVQTPLGIFHAFFVLFFLAPDVVVSKGGYGSVPCVVAARLLRVAIFVHESDSVPGKANVRAGKFAVEVFVSFPDTKSFPSGKVMLIGNPIRREILEGSKEEARELFDLQGNKPILLVVGGSQGAQRINDMLLAILEKALLYFEIIHQTGEAHIKQVSQETQATLSEELAPYYHPVGFFQETQFKHAYAAADLIVSRAGAGSIFEIAALGKPSMLIPLPESAQNHQVRNAYAYAHAGAAIVLEHTNLQPHFFLQRAKDIVEEESFAMAKAAQEFARPRAASVMAEYLLSYLLQ